MLYIWDALRHRNVVQLFLQLWFQLAILTYAILQIPQSYNALDELEDERCGAFAVRDGPITHDPAPLIDAVDLSPAFVCCIEPRGVLLTPSYCSAAKALAACSTCFAPSSSSRQSSWVSQASPSSSSLGGSTSSSAGQSSTSSARVRR